MNIKLKERILESLSAVLPITGIVFLISIILVPVEIGTMVMFLSGAVMLVIGMHSDARGIVLSLPVDGITGLNG